jgi:hypothetical protein
MSDVCFSRNRLGPMVGAHAHSGRHYRRFGALERWLHAGMMFAFIGCSLSGLPLLFPVCRLGPGCGRSDGGL